MLICSGSAIVYLCEFDHVDLQWVSCSILGEFDHVDL